MGITTDISWCDSTWNPVRGCSRVSEGCRNCYAEKVAYRFSGPGQPYEGLVQVDKAGVRLPKWNGEVDLVMNHLLDPLGWKKPRRIFVNSMGDLFHPNVPDVWIDRVFAVMALAPQHTFQVLTKRPERMRTYLRDCISRLIVAIMAMRFDSSRTGVGPLPYGVPGSTWFPLANVWLGVSVENQEAADERIPLLLRTPAAVRFVSAEPLLGQIYLEESEQPELNVRWLYGEPWVEPPIPRLDWVIVGGESGTKARPMHVDWARSLRDQCITANTPFFFKQNGEWKDGSDFDKRAKIVLNDGRVLDSTEGLSRDDERAWASFSPRMMLKVGKKSAGDLLDGREWKQFPAVSA